MISGLPTRAHPWNQDGARLRIQPDRLGLTRNVDVLPKYLILNCEEGEPGVFKDRHLMEGVPHRLIEGAVIAAYAAGVGQGYIYINAEANLSAERMQAAIDSAYANGLLGKDVLGSGFDLEIEDSVSALSTPRFLANNTQLAA